MKVKELKKKIEVEHVKIFLTHYENYLDICLGYKKFGDIKKLKDELKIKLSLGKITKEEYLKGDAEIFNKYISEL